MSKLEPGQVVRQTVMRCGDFFGDFVTPFVGDLSETPSSGPRTS